MSGMMERFNNWQEGMSPAVGKLGAGQIANQQTWGRVADDQMSAAAMHAIRIVPMNGTTVTYVNPLDPSGDGSNEWLDPPCAWDKVNSPGWRKY